jgi:hypothetical protein
VRRIAGRAIFFALTVALVGLYAGCAGPSAASSETISVRWLPDPATHRSVTVEVAGLNPAVLEKLRAPEWTVVDWQRVLSIQADQTGMVGDLPPMSGTYEIQSNRVRFHPTFPLEATVRYRAVLRIDKLPGTLPDGRVVVSHFELARIKPGKPTVVEQIYPSAAVVPENLLKFYIHFSAPMRRGVIYQHLHLRYESGKTVELPFLEIDEELWDPAMTRLTLFIDPGRIKRGVRPLEEIGPALEAGKRYTLVIDRKLQDATGNPIKETFRRTFLVGPPDRAPIDPGRWKLQVPPAESRRPLRLLFSKSMDHALAQRLIRVTDSSGVILDGAIRLEDEERTWLFTPDRPWRRGSYHLVAQTTLEDLAGNNIGKSFEVDLFDNVERHLTNSVVTQLFEIR